MDANQMYELVVSDLFRESRGVVSGADAEIAILDGGEEIERLKFTGKIGPDGPGYRKLYRGKLGLTAELVSGCCKIRFCKTVAPGFNVGV
jgi:hypothetical protein